MNMPDPNDHNNAFIFFRDVIRNINNPIVVDNYPPALTNFLIFSSLILGISSAYLGIQSIGKSKEVYESPTGEIFNRPTDEEIKNYSEKFIDMKNVCLSEFMKNEGKKDLGVSEDTTIHPDSIFPRISNSTDVWPVYRWGCIYKEKSSEKGVSRLIGIDMKKYCQTRWKEIAVSYSYGYKDYLNPYSWYCTSVANEAMDTTSVEKEEMNPEP